MDSGGVAMRMGPHEVAHGPPLARPYVGQVRVCFPLLHYSGQDHEYDRCYQLDILAIPHAGGYAPSFEAVQRHPTKDL